MQSTTDNFEKKNDAIYADFDKAKSINPQKVTLYWKKAQEAKKLSQELKRFIKSVHNIVLSKTEQITEDQADTLHLKYAEKKDDYDTPTNILIGDSHDGSAGLSAELRKQIESYKIGLLSLLREEDRDESKLGLDTKSMVEHNGIKHNWEMNNFYHTPLAATVTILSQIQNEVKNAEYYVISKLMEEFGKEDIPFDTVAAKVIATSNYVLQGEEYHAQLFLAAYSQTQQPKMYIGSYDSISNSLTNITDTVLVTNGIGNYSIPTDREGVFQYNGTIQMTTPNGDVRTFPFQSEYIVAKPNLVVSPTKMLVFYKGPVNPVEISVPGVASENIVVNPPAGVSVRKIAGSEYEVVVSTNAAKKVKIAVSAKMPDGSIKFMGDKIFETKRLPEPKAKVGTIRIGGNMTKQQLCAQQGIAARYAEDFLFKLPVGVTSFDIEFKTRGNLTPTKKVNGKRFPAEVKDIMCGLRRGDKVFITNIRAKNSVGDNYRLGSITITII
ncbi:MAG: hypothetical protein JKY42_08275 [Flavobacteriales bacterium]|nr:hypothetical protein [Flavobacteriales bacterium]